MGSTIDSSVLLCWGSLLVAACAAPSKAPTARLPESTLPRLAASSAPSWATSASRPTVAVTPELRAAVTVAVDKGSAVINERVVSLDEGSRVNKVEGLYEELTKLGKQAGPLNERDFAFSVSENATGLGFLSVFQTAAVAGWPRCTLDIGSGKHAKLNAVVPWPPNLQPPVEWPTAPLLFIARAQGVEVWRMPMAGQPNAVPRKVVQATRDGLAQSLTTPLATECATNRPCDRVLLMLDRQIHASMISSALSVLATLPQTQNRELNVFVMLAEPPPLGTTPAVFDTAASKGTLPPGVIQAEVRSNHSKVRACYDRGLAKHPRLAGKVTVRFTIRPDGKTADVAAADGTTLADTAVVACILDVFGKLEFPKPAVGTVTIVYPLDLSPAQ